MKYTITKKNNGPLYVTEEDMIKENANCPASEKTGEGPGSCGGKVESAKDIIKKIDDYKSLKEKEKKDMHSSTRFHEVTSGPMKGKKITIPDEGKQAKNT